MMFSKSSCSFLSLFIFPIIIFKASAQSNCTTLQPVFIYPKDGTSTVFASTTTTTSAVDCAGCSLAVSTFQAVINPSASINTTLSLPLTTSSTFFCAPSTTSAEPTTPISLPSGPIATPTASPLPPLNGTASTLISDLQTALLYLELLGNGNLQKLCSVISPAALSNITGINGTAVQSEVCGGASVEKFDPALAEIAAASNRLGVDFVFTALFAVQVAGGFAGGTDLNMLCGEIEATLLNEIFQRFIPGVGTVVKDFVCGKANGTVVARSWR